MFSNRSNIIGFVRRCCGEQPRTVNITSLQTDARTHGLQNKKGLTTILQSSYYLLTYLYPVVSRGIFSVVPSDKTMCSEVDSASENEYQGFLLR